MNLTILTTIADISVALAYFAIPAELWYFYKRLTIISKGRTFPDEFKQVLYLFVIFICCCGLTHLVMAFYPYKPVPLLNCIMKGLTGIISLFTSYKLIIVIPRVLYYPIYTQNIEQENLDRQLHEHYLQENINIFRDIREYTQTMSGQTLQSLYDDLLRTLFERLHIEVALYMFNTSTNICERTTSNPLDLLSPQSIDYDNPDATAFIGKWWLINFDSGYANHRGYVALKTEIQSEVITTRRNIILKGNDEESSLLLPETTATVTLDMTDKTYFIDIITDIVEHFENYLAQLISKQKNQELIDKLTTQNEILIKARSENQTIAKQSREWLSVMSHEMRTPLFAIQSLAELVLPKVSEDKDLYSSVDLIFQSSRHLFELINNILDFSKLENDDFKLESSEFILQDVVNESFSLNIQNDKRLYPQCCVFFDSPLPTYVIGDSTRIKQIFLNLISNSLKFTPDEGIISVHVSAKELEGDKWNIYVEVRDTGIGIKDKDIHKIFLKFSQSDSSITRRFGGTGLGLSICKKLCRLMDGDIDFKKNEGGGTIFFFNIVVQKGTSIDIIDKSLTVPDALKKWKVTIVDDTPIISRSTVKLFHDLGFEDVNVYNDPSPLFSTDISGLFVLNIRSKCLTTDLPRLTDFLTKHADRTLLHTTPFLQKELEIKADKLLMFPITHFDLLTMLMQIASEWNMLSHKGIFNLNRNLIRQSPLNLHILIAEDNMVNQAVLKKIMSTLGVTADFAENGEVACTLYETALVKYPVILMDIMMPVMDGYTATQKIRDMTKKATEPWIIALTANALYEDQVKAYESGANDFLVKPSKINSIREALLKAKTQLDIID